MNCNNRNKEIVERDGFRVLVFLCPLRRLTCFISDAKKAASMALALLEH